MDNFIPFEKLSKKKKKEYYDSQRNDWGDIRPITKFIESKKLYKRHPKHRKENYEDFEESEES